MSASLKRVLWYWVPALLWMAVVLAASTDTFSAENTGSVLQSVLSRIFGSVDARTLDLVNYAIRKSAHFTEYAFLSALWFRARRGELAGIWRARWAWLGVAVSLLVAILDEWHQSFVPSRGPSARDVLLDFCGALFAQLVIWMALRARSRPAAAA